MTSKIYRVCGNRLDQIHSDWPPSPIPAFNDQQKLQKLVKEDIGFAFLPNFPKSDTRFGDGSWCVFYSAKEPETAIHEVAYHFRKDHYGKAHTKKFKTARKVIYQIEADFRAQKSVPDHNDYYHPTSYAESQKFAKKAIQDGCCSLSARSTRYNSGISYPIFDRQVLLTSVMLHTKFSVRWYPGDDKLTHFASERETDIQLLNSDV